MFKQINNLRLFQNYLLSIFVYYLLRTGHKYPYFTIIASMIFAPIQSQTINVPIYVPKTPLQVLKIHFPLNNTLFIRSILISDVQYLEISIFGPDTLSFYFYDLFEKKTLQQQVTILFQNWTELLDQLFGSEFTQICLKWPRKKGNAYVQITFFKNQQKKSLQFQVTHRIKNVDTLLSVKTQLKLLQMKVKRKQIIEIEKKVEQVKLQTQNLKSSIPNYPQFEKKDEKFQLYIDVDFLKRYKCSKDYGVATRKRMLIAHSYDVPVQQYLYSPQKASPLSKQKLYKKYFNNFSEDNKTEKNSQRPVNQTKIGLDFSNSFYLKHFEIVKRQNSLLVTKRTSEKKFYHLHHCRPIVQNIQEFSLRPVVNTHHDITFGLLGASALKQNRMEWPMQLIAYIGCTYQIMNGLQFQKIPVVVENGGLLTIRVNLSLRKVQFLLNGQQLGEQQQMDEQMANECYFFYETSTQGNSVIFPLKE